MTCVLEPCFRISNSQRSPFQTVRFLVKSRIRPFQLPSSAPVVLKEKSTYGTRINDEPKNELFYSRAEGQQKGGIICKAYMYTHNCLYVLGSDRCKCKVCLVDHLVALHPGLIQATLNLTKRM